MLRLKLGAQPPSSKPLCPSLETGFMVWVLYLLGWFCLGYFFLCWLQVWFNTSQTPSPEGPLALMDQPCLKASDPLRIETLLLAVVHQRRRHGAVVGFLFLSFGFVVPLGGFVGCFLVVYFPSPLLHWLGVAILLVCVYNRTAKSPLKVKEMQKSGEEKRRKIRDE